jgi:hypothetical protein
MRRHNVWARLLLAALVMFLGAALMGCASASGSVRLGREPRDVVLHDQALIDLVGGSLDQAISELVRQGVPEREARRRVFDAQIARAGTAPFREEK